MQYIITLSQLFLFVLFIYTLACELSKNHSDSLIHICLRTITMCSSAIVFFLLFDKKHYTQDFLALVFIPLASLIVYQIVDSIVEELRKDVFNNLPRR